ncbi:secretin N-terminal domain-containing protein [Undibacterium sp. Dicai25W]|uniref:secretin N-terminal domain-containing protein n=1 Tax=Undibacterium sp. Dicai25W TaxID=3413034 RepID=UPI003BF2AFAC
MLSQNKFEDGLSKLKSAMIQAPDNLEYRKTYLSNAEKIAYTLNAQADAAIKSGDYNFAKSNFLRVINIDPENDFAKLGLTKLDQLERHPDILANAQSAFEQKNLNEANRLVKKILSENPDNDAANKLAHQIAHLNDLEPQISNNTVSLKKPISIEFKDATIRQIFEVISRTSGINFLFDKEIKTDQRASIFLRNSTIDSAIHFLLITNQLERQILDDNTMLIYPSTPGKQKEYQEMLVKSFFLTNADAKKVENTLRTILKTKDIIVDEKLNMLIVRDTSDAIKLAEKLVALHDVPEPEVMLEVEVLEIKRTRLMELGVQWPNSLSLTPLPTVAGGTLTLQDLRSNLHSSTIGATIGPVTAKARRETGDANLLANPRIRAKNHEKAKILIGERVPNISTTATSTGFISESINYIDVGLKLEVEPTVYLDNDVGIKVALEVSSVTDQLKTQSGTVAYHIGTRTASTTLRLKNGETQVLAGLINNEERNSATKVPGVGEIPLLGRLFGSQLDDNQKTEIVLSITPHLIRNIQQPDGMKSEFNSGTETNFKAHPDFIETSGKGNNSVIAPNSVGSAQTGQVSSNQTFANSINGMSPSNAQTAADIAKLEWQGPKFVKIGDVFSVQLLMQSGQPVKHTDLIIGFDSQALQAVSVNEGIFMKQGGVQTSFVNQIDPKGQISLSNGRAQGAASNLGNLVTFNFRALAVTNSTPIQIINIKHTSGSGQALPSSQLAPMNIEIHP